MGRRSTASIAAAAGEPADPLFVVLESLRQINQELRIAGRATEQRLGVSSAQLFVLETLSNASAESLNELAARTFTRHSSVSVVVSRLVDAGLVERRPSADDGRRVLLGLTRAGRALVRTAPESAQLRLVESARRLSATRLAQLAGGLSALRRALLGLSGVETAVAARATR